MYKHYVFKDNVPNDTQTIVWCRKTLFATHLYINYFKLFFGRRVYKYEIILWEKFSLKPWIRKSFVYLSKLTTTVKTTVTDFKQLLLTVKTTR